MISMPNAINLLKQDHQQIRQLLDDLVGSTGRAVKKRQQLMQKIEKELAAHTQIEEEIFYPAFLESVGKQDEKRLYYEAIAAHQTVDMILARMKEADPGTPEYGGQAKVLKDLVEHHIKEEESIIFKLARSAMGKDKLDELGERLEQREQELRQSRPNGKQSEEPV